MIHYKKNIYIIVSKTDTPLGKLIRLCLGVKYNHCSIALDESLEQFYSFGRKEIHDLFKAGFVRESKNQGFFKEHNDAYITVLKIPVTDRQWHSIAEEIAMFNKQKDDCKYSFLGLLFCYLGIPKKRKHKYFCSQFVAEVLEHANAKLLDKPPTLVRPHDFLNISQGDVIYKGAIGCYEAA